MILKIIALRCTVILTNISLGGSQFDWNFGDGTTRTTFAPPDTLSHIFVNNTDNDTTYIIQMQASNASGCADSMQRSVFLYPQVAANFDFDSPNSGCNPLPVVFINDSKGKNVNYNWDFGDKTSSTSPAPPPKLYQNNTSHDTTYLVTLTVTNPVGCDSSMTKPVQVFSAVIADFSSQPVSTVVHLLKSGLTIFLQEVSLILSGNILHPIRLITAQFQRS